MQLVVFLPQLGLWRPPAVNANWRASDNECLRVQYMCRESQADAKPISRRLDLILYHSH